jgi:hypothetical protein
VNEAVDGARNDNGDEVVDGAPPALVPTHPSSNSSSDDMDKAIAIDTENGSDKSTFLT